MAEIGFVFCIAGGQDAEFSSLICDRGISNKTSTQIGVAIYVGNAASDIIRPCDGLAGEGAIFQDEFKRKVRGINIQICHPHRADWERKSPEGFCVQMENADAINGIEDGDAGVFGYEAELKVFVVWG